MAIERNTIKPRERPKKVPGITEKVKTGCGYLYVTVNQDNEGPCEVFITLGKAGGCAEAMMEAIGRLISLSLRSGVSYEVIIKYLRGIRCPSIAWDEGIAVLSCADGVAKVLEKHLLPHNE